VSSSSCEVRCRQSWWQKWIFRQFQCGLIIMWNICPGCCKDAYAYISPQTYYMVYGCTREGVCIDREYSYNIFDTDLTVIPGDLYTMALTRPRVTCCRYIIPLSRRRPPALPKPVYNRNEGKETQNERMILRTQSDEPISPTTDRYAQWQRFGRFGARGNSTSICGW